MKKDLVKVVFIFAYHFATKQDDIMIELPIDHVPRVGTEVTFDYELAEDLESFLPVVESVQYVYNKNSLGCIKIYLKSVDD